MFPLVSTVAVEFRPITLRRFVIFVLSAINVLPSWYKRGGPDSPEHIAEVWSDLILGMVCHSQGRRRPRRDGYLLRRRIWFWMP